MVIHHVSYKNVYGQHFYWPDSWILPIKWSGYSMSCLYGPSVSKVLYWGSFTAAKFQFDDFFVILINIWCEFTFFSFSFFSLANKTWQYSAGILIWLQAKQKYLLSLFLCLLLSLFRPLSYARLDFTVLSVEVTLRCQSMVWTTRIWPKSPPFQNPLLCQSHFDSCPHPATSCLARFVHRKC